MAKEKNVTYLSAVSHVRHKWLIWRFGWFWYFGIILDKRQQYLKINQLTWNLDKYIKIARVHFLNKKPLKNSL